MNSNLKLLPAALLVAMLALAGCGGGSDDMPDPDPMPMPDPPPPPPDTSLEDAVDAQRNAAAASARAMELLEEATEAGGALAASDVDGSSQGAYDNAMTVLGAGALIEAERVKAAAAVAAIEAIDTSDMSADAMARIANILETAEASLAEIVAIQEAEGDDSLAMTVAGVKSGAATDDSDSKIAQAKAKLVSDAIAAAILTATGETTAAIGTPVASSGAPEGSIMHVGMSGMTFAEIAGSARMATTKVGDFTSDAAGETALAALTGGALGGTTDAYYKGIQGSLVCLSAACTVDTDGDITGTVEFVPTNPGWRYYLTEVGGNYARQLNAATYGHWLTETDDGTTVINLHHESLALATTETGALSWVHGNDNADDDVDASYSGNAMGYSHRTVGTGDDATTSSGEFTANVSLSATFTDTAAEASLSGSISGFAGGAHVNPAWRVTLGEATDPTTDNTFTGTVPDGSAHGKHFASDGDWAAHGYGAAGKNPTGFVGAFDAAFGTEGEAAGVFHAD